MERDGDIRGDRATSIDSSDYLPRNGEKGGIGKWKGLVAVSHWLKVFFLSSRSIVYRDDTLGLVFVET